MAISKSSAIWKGNLKDGKGSMLLDSDGYEGSFSYLSRFEGGAGTNPEEMIGAPHAGCFSQYLALILSQAGHTPTRIDTTAKFHLGE